MLKWKEKDLFEWLSKNHYKTLVNSKNPISRWDCYDIETQSRIELKCRKKHYDTLILEKYKYDAMILKCNDNLDIPMYINSTPEGIYSFNLFEIKPKWEVKYLRKTTRFTNANQIPKEIAMLPVIDAEIL